VKLGRYGIAMTNDGFLRPHDNTPFTDSANVPVAGLSLNDGVPIPKRRVWSWALWDWATQPFATVILTFVFVALYLISDSFIDPEIAALGPDNQLYKNAIAELSVSYGWAGLLAGFLIATLAPVLGQRADAFGQRKLWLGVGTGLLVVCTAGLFFVEAVPSFFWLGAILVAAGTVFSEIAGVNYNAMISQVADSKNVGKVSGLGWGFGYLGGIVALIIVVLVTELDFFGMSTDNGMGFRAIALGAAVWTVVFAIPIFVSIPSNTPSSAVQKSSFFGSYVVLARDVRDLYRNARQTLLFLVAAAIYRDGLSGVFTYGAILATAAFGFSATEVIMFGIAANIIAGVSTIAAGWLDDVIGPRRLILFAISGLLVAGLGVFFLQAEGKIIFWTFGLLLTAFVGPIQSASRSLVARLTPAGREGQVFGLYATTGRAASFMGPAAWIGALSFAAAIGSTNPTVWGILGILGIVFVGFLVLLLVKIPQNAQRP